MSRVTPLTTALVALAMANLGGCRSESTQDRSVNASDTTATVGSTAGKTAATAPPATRCDAKTISADGVGPIRIGADVDSVKSFCDVVRDTTQRGGEGMMERRITISIPPGKLDAEIVDGRVWRLDIRSPSFRTADSLGVGSTLSELLRHQDPKPAAGEGIVVVMLRDHCGMSFVLAGGFRSGVFRKWIAAELAKLPSSTKVERVFVVGCPKNAAKPRSATQLNPLDFLVAGWSAAKFAAIQNEGIDSHARAESRLRGDERAHRHRWIDPAESQMRLERLGLGDESCNAGSRFRDRRELNHSLRALVDPEPENPRAVGTWEGAECVEANAEGRAARRTAQQLNDLIAGRRRCRAEETQGEVPVLGRHRLPR